MRQPTDRDVIEEMFTGECDPEPQEESDAEQDLRASGAFVEGMTRLGRVLDKYAELAKPHVEKGE